jgi:hypothetical protein
MLLFFGFGYLVGGCSGLLVAGLLLASHRGRQMPEPVQEYAAVTDR